MFSTTELPTDNIYTILVAFNLIDLHYYVEHNNDEMMKNGRVPKYTFELPSLTNEPNVVRRPAVVHMIAIIMEKDKMYFIATISVGGPTVAI